MSKIENTTGKLKIIPLGGMEQIGMNITAFEYEDSIIVVDCGLAFPENDMLGIDLVIPDVTYLKDNIDKVKGFFITHGHEDHIGAIPYVLRDINVPIYATKLTIGLIEHKLEEHEIQFLGLTPEEAKTATVYEPVGCQRCGGRGYFERTGVYEILEVSHRVRDLIASRAPTAEIRDAAVEEGMSTLHSSARRLVLEGETTISEMMRISVEGQDDQRGHAEERLK